MLEIIHEPLGIEDPYTTRPDERQPREPRAEEPVFVALLTRPAGAAAGVSVEVSTTHGLARITAEPRPDVEGSDRWVAELGRFAAGETVTYRATAQSHAGEIAATADSTFTVTSWQALARVTGWEVRDTAVLLRLSAPNVDGAATIAFSFANQDQLIMRVWPRGMPAGTDARGAVRMMAREQGDLLVITAGPIELRVARLTGALEIWRHGQVAVKSPPGTSLAAWLGVGSTPHAVRLSLCLEDGEALYGSGERFDHFDRRGKRFDLRVYEQYKDQGARTYLPVPLLLSSRGHALAVDGTRPLTIDAGAADPRCLEIDAEVARDPEACLAVRLFLTATPLEGLQAYLRETGLPVQPPEWAFGLWMSANDWNSQARVLEVVLRGQAEEVPGDVVVIEAWSDEATFYIWNDAEYETLPADRPPRLADFRFPPEGRWPDPKGLLDTLHAQGIRLLLWQIPLQKHMDDAHPQNEADTQTLIARRWCAQQPDGTPYRNPGWWFTGALLPDFTSTEATEWWLSRRRYLVEELGVDGFKTDGGEHIWGNEVVFADGRRGAELINAFPVLYAGAYHRLLAGHGRGDGMTFSRAGFAGSQRYPAHWAGDENSTWEAFRHSIVAGLSAGASGIPFWGWDIGGFSQEIPSGELYRRAWMMATFCPIMQYHSEYNANREPCRDRTPWNIAGRTGDPDVLPVCREYTHIRRQLRPYILREAAHTAATGRPLMCAMALAFPDDSACRRFPYQYMFGRDLLIAPTVEEGISRQPVYLPAGSWRDLWSKEMIEGPTTVERSVPADLIPVYVRGDAVSPLSPDA